jgi:hypothetical protein
MNKIRIVKKEAWCFPEIIEIEDNLGIMQDIVGGNLESVHCINIDNTILLNITLICNEDWRYLELDANLWHPDIIENYVGGTIFVMAHNSGGDPVSMSDGQANKIVEWLNKYAIENIQNHSQTN